MNKCVFIRQIIIRFHSKLNVCMCVDAYAIGCGVLATIEQWYPTRKFNGTMVPHKRNSKVWPGLVTKEKTMKYPTSAMCTVCVRLFRHSNRGLITKGTIGSPVGKRPPFAKRVQNI